MSDIDLIMKTASDYARRGFSVIPIGRDKKPAMAWKSAQIVAAKAEEVHDWFGRQRGLVGVGIVLGRISGGLYVRDFDVAESYQAWSRAHPELAKRLPTVQTSRGFHVYARWDGVRTTTIGDGELRGEGAYVVAPPSPHASGVIYAWLVPLPEADLPECEPGAAGLARSWLVTADHATERTERTEAQSNGDSRDTDETEDTEDTEAVLRAVLCENRRTIEDAIRRTVPKAPGLRNSHIFKFARAVRAIPGLPRIPVERIGELREVVREWWTLARPNMITKDFGTTWGDFVHAWPKVKFAEGEDVLGDAMRLARLATPPAWSADYGPEGQLLAALCRELQRKAGGKEPFFLSCQTAGQCVGVDKRSAHRWFAGFVADKAIVEVRKGKIGTATRWKYVADDLHK
jgi:hypothetical protein